MILGTTQAAIGAVILFLAIVIVLVFLFINARQSRPEVGSEVELAPNRKPYYSDEELEGKKLDRVLTIGLLGLFICALGVPLYWLAEPGRQAGAVKNFNSTFAKAGGNLFATTAKGGFNCAFCHGEKGVGNPGVDYVITDADGRFQKQVSWKGPALNTVLLRFSRDEVRYILTYGRPFSPMPAWGVKGGGAMDDQQLQNLIDYLQSIQLTPKQAQAEAKDGLKKEKAAAEKAGKPYATDGEALFNLGYYSGFAGGAYSCGRCHTTGWSYNDKLADGSGAMGPNLTNGDTLKRFPGDVVGLKQQLTFVCTGSEQGKLYGQNGQGTGRMPGFCITPEEKADPTNGEVGVEKKTPGTADQGGMYTQDQVRAIVEYERSL